MRIVRWTSLPLVLGLLAAGCDRSGSAPKGTPGATATAPDSAAATPPVEPPKGLVYPGDPVVLTKGVAMAPDVPYREGGACWFTVKPDLPEGLKLESLTGVITGTPKKVLARTSYEVKAQNGLGASTALVTLTINDAAPGGVEVALPAHITVGNPALKASTKDQGEGVTYEWSVSGGTLASGQGTPSITIKPEEVGDLTVQLKVTNSGGTATGRAQAQVVAAPDATLDVPGAVRPGEDWMTASVKAQPGMTYTWSILPGTTGATIVEGQGTSTIRFASNPAYGVFQIQVKVANEAGDSASAIGAVQVLP